MNTSNNSNPSLLVSSNSESDLTEVRNINIISNQIIPQSKLPFPCCCFPDSENISKWQYITYLNFLQICEENYTKENKEHSDKLLELEKLGKEIMESKNKNISVWRFLGFQSNIPENDFRAGGILSLEFMLYVLQNKILNDDCFNHPYFLFALTCIKILYNTKIFLYLFDPNTMKVFIDSKKYYLANRKQIRKYCLIDGYQKKFFFELNSVFLKYIYKKFALKVNLVKKEENYTLIEPIIETSTVNILFNLCIEFYWKSLK